MQKIMFNEQFGLQQATLDKTKDMTRRVALKDPVEDMNFGYDTNTQQCIICSGDRIVARSTYAVGEVVAVAQRYSQIISAITNRFAPHSKDWMRDEAGWNNKMFVKAEWMPHHIKIIDIKVEPLCGISDEDCLREGITTTKGGFRLQDAYTFKGDKVWWKTPYLAYKELIDRINRRGFFESNPIVFVYTYELID